METPPAVSLPPSRPVSHLRAFAAVTGLLVATMVLLDAAAPGGRGFLVVTRLNIDSICYFGTAHSLWFDRDFDLTNQLAVLLPDDSPMSPGARRWVAIVPSTSLPGSPYAIGYSLLGIPFLAAGTLIDSWTGAAADGYGPWAERLFAAANAVYLALALLLLHLWLVKASAEWSGDQREVSRRAAIAVFALVPGTALGYYAFTVMSHTVSFLAVIGFLLAWWSARDSFDLRPWLAVGAVSGLMVLCRWQDALFLVALLAYELAEPGRLRRREWWISRGLAAAVCLVLLIPQLWQWRTIYGSWFTIPQGSQFMEWPPSKVLHVLFSSHNGLVFTTPATLAGALGLIWAVRHSRRWLGPLLLAALIQVALVGSMPTNWNGRAFAMRLLINLLPLAALGFLFLFLRGSPAVRRFTYAWIAAGTVFTVLSAVQWRYEFVPRNDRLTAAEAFTDKLRLKSAYRRHQAMAAARSSSELEQVRARHGDSAVLLRRLQEAHAREGTAAPALDKLLEDRGRRRLF